MRNVFIFPYFLFSLFFFSVRNTISAQEVYPTDCLQQDSATTDWVGNFRLRADSMIQNSHICKTAQTGIYFYDLTADSAIFDYGSLQMMRPASVMKTVTAITALHKLGGSYKYKTELLYSGNIVDSTLNGDLYILAGYDPCFGGSDMVAFMDALKDHGIHSIQGKIIADISIKDTTKLGFGWLWNWEQDEKPLTPLLFNSDDTFMEKFFESLDFNGIVHPETYETGIVPKHNTTSLCKRHHTIDEVLLQMLKQSDNQYAESLFFQLGALNKIPYASYKESAKYVLDFIRHELKEDPDWYSVYDGCGLSVYDCVSPKLIVKFLRYAYKHKHIYHHFYPSLPIGGEDGTLAQRMKASSLKGNIHAKTGTVSRVITLAGYCNAPNGHELAFAIFHNGIYSSKNTRNWDDSLLELLMEK